MAQKKGQTGNPNGRPKGAKNKRTLQWEALGEAITGECTERFYEEIEKLEGKEYIDAYTKILEYFKPKQNRTDITSGGEKISPPKIKFF